MEEGSSGHPRSIPAAVRGSFDTKARGPACPTVRAEWSDTVLRNAGSKKSEDSQRGNGSDRTPPPPETRVPPGGRDGPPDPYTVHRAAKLGGKQAPAGHWLPNHHLRK